MPEETVPPVQLWSRLPTELQLQILSYLLTEPEPLNEITHNDTVENALAPLIRVGNHEFANRVYQSYYESNTFIMSHFFRYATSAYGTGKSSLQYPSPRFGHLIKHLMLPVKLHMMNDSRNIWFEPGAQWQWLFKPVNLARLAAASEYTLESAPLDLEGRTRQSRVLLSPGPETTQSKHRSNWQTHFPNLTTFELDLVVGSGTNTMQETTRNPLASSYKLICIEPFLPHLMAAFEGSFAPLQTNRLLVKVCCVGCRKNGRPLATGRVRPVAVEKLKNWRAPACECEGRIRDALGRVLWK
ncbi:hypothetical protein CC86DRAFT_407775 [Ophiobolus disseminans]|uniref:Uncharacterized protein n=1 Tax=Ophiobolus disseminans TaxID=1469910 RepID=A0A6A6ZW55_9PLEO|nr:hypothetical protein CC86DRAFT_407775 [Ophiobolus disseminans]